MNHFFLYNHKFPRKPIYLQNHSTDYPLSAFKRLALFNSLSESYPPLFNIALAILISDGLVTLKLVLSPLNNPIS